MISLALCNSIVNTKSMRIGGNNFMNIYLKKNHLISKNTLYDFFFGLSAKNLFRRALNSIHEKAFHQNWVQCVVSV